MSRSTHWVETGPELADACEDASRGDTIRVDDGAEIDLTGISPTNLPHDVRLVAGTGAHDRPAATVHVGDTRRADDPLVDYGNATVRGIAFSGPQTAVVPRSRAGGDYYYSPIHLRGEEATVGGCAFHGFPLAGLKLGSAATATRALVENTTFDHHLMRGYGYGIEHYNGFVEVRDCQFDWIRHAISSFGYPTCSFWVHDSTIGEHVLGHGFDMHRIGENLTPARLNEYGLDGSEAGGSICIEDCEFRFTHDLDGEPQEAIAVRGVPTEQCVVERNRFAHPREPDPPGGRGAAYRQETVDRWTNFTARDNRFGVRSN